VELRDLIVTPLLLIIIYVVAYVVRPYVTDAGNYRYFIPGLTARIVGALTVGFIYQFYYGGGDTFAYHTHGSRHIWEAIMESPDEGFRLLFSGGSYGPGLWQISEKIWYWRDPNSFYVIQIATIFDLITFSSYSGTAVLFAVVAFAGGWLFFLTFYNEYPEFKTWLAFSVLFVPSVVFWGSGIFKDSLTLAGLGVATFAFQRIFIKQRVTIGNIFLLLVSFWIIYSIKKYILLSFLPAILLWWFASKLASIKTMALRIILVPFVVVLAAFLIFTAVQKVAEDDPRYNFSRLSETARITSYDIRYGWGARTGEGSGYTLGVLDGSWQSMIRLAPSAINVSLFRPYLWEIKNPLMVLSALEALVCLIFTVYILFRTRMSIFRYLKNPDILFCFSFSLVFAFAVGVSTGNFGTLSRYKIPMMPFYFLTLSLLYNYWKRDRKLDVFEATE
jgi:hypothetical protein